MQCGILVALPLVHAARHNDVKPLLGRELMILTHDDDDDVCMYVEVCMYVCIYVCMHLLHMYVFIDREHRRAFGWAPRCSTAAPKRRCRV